MSNEISAITVFVSYSWDSPEHKQWVGKFATALRKAGIEVILDQWDTDYGDDLAKFMEKSVSEAHRVLIVCTDEYVRKADAGKGGVGYEKMIVTSELVKDIGTKKFVPIMRQGNDKPLFLGSRKHADFRNDDTFDKELEDLAISLKQGTAFIKPPLGKSEEKKALPDKPIELPEANNNPADVYKTAISLARSGDILGWRKFAQGLKGSFKPELKMWREKHEQNPPSNIGTLHEAVDEAIQYIAPPIVMALAGIESENDKLNDQRSLFDEFYHITDWSRSGRVILIDLPITLGFIYQGLHGAVCMHSNQYNLALKLATMQIGFGSSDKKIPLWQHHGVMGWPESLGRNSVDAWKYLSNAFDRWEWLKEIFGNSEEYKISLISYYMILNFYEFAQTLHDSTSEVFEKSELRLDIPINFSIEDNKLCEKALSRIAKHPEIFELILKEWKITKEQAIAKWPRWIEICNYWLSKVFTLFYDEAPQTKLMEYLGWKK